jgi:hypothetical protein
LDNSRKFLTPIIKMPGGYTRIEDLPDIDDFAGVANPREGGGGNNPGADQVGSILDRQKYIRKSQKMMQDAGMGAYGPPPQGGPEEPQFQEEEMVPMPRELRIPSRPDPMNFHCIDIATHIQNCPVCSKFYNGDKSLYNIIIVVLAIVCILLLKKVMNV